MAAGVGGYNTESNGNLQEDFDGMEKETLVTKLKQVEFCLQLDGLHSRWQRQQRLKQYTLSRNVAKHAVC